MVIKIITSPPLQKIGIRKPACRPAAQQRVVAIAPNKLIRPRATIEIIVSVITPQPIIVFLTVQAIISLETIQPIVSISTVECIITSVTDNGIIATKSVHSPVSNIYSRGWDLNRIVVFG